MRSMSFARISIVALSTLVSATAFAVPITGLYNTGAGFSAGQQDTHYQLSKTGGDGPAIGSYGFETSSVWPVGTWLNNSATSQWLTPLANQATSFDSSSAGIYTWRLAFDLAGFDASSASFAGRWATDNSGTILLNGTALLNPSTGFTSWASFSSAGGLFNAGLNNLDFVVTNARQSGGNPTGLRVEFTTSDVRVAAVPEPGTLALLGLALAGLGVVRRRK